MTGLQLAIATGVCLGLAAVIALWQLLPHPVDPVDYVDRTSPTRHRHRTLDPLPDVTSRRDRLGVWATRVAPPGLWRNTRAADLDILGIPVHRHYGRKIVLAGLGLLIPPAATYVLTLYGTTLPVVVPGLASLAVAALLFVRPDYEVRVLANDARAEMVHALTAYIDLIALQRRGGAGARDAMTQASLISRGWAFRRIAQELRRSELDRQMPWDALRELSHRIEVPQLEDLANVMRMSERSGAQIYSSLRARASSLRGEILADQKTKANDVSERLVVPAALTGLIGVVIFVTPFVLRFLQTA